MAEPEFDRKFDVRPGYTVRLSPLIRRVVAGNPGPFTFKGTSTFIVGNGKVAVIDPGPDDGAHLEAILKAVDGETVTHILVTHSHADHSPLARTLKEKTGAPILGARLPVIGGGDGAEAGIDCSFSPDAELGDGDWVEGMGWHLETVATPGHLPNHLCFALAEEQALFSGDHVMSWSTSIVAPPHGRMGNYLASLRKLLPRNDIVYHPGHGPSRQDPLPLVQALLAHRRMREDAILARIAEGDRSIERIVDHVYIGLDPKLKAAARLSALAHVQHLIEQGKVSDTGGGQFVLAMSGAARG
jgi:glyoxylase-like metal-dependent hydrolase (beta-lactamase superfamily II)